MAALKNLLGEVKRRLAPAGASSCSTCGVEGNTPEFNAERQKWQETCTQDLVLADFAKYLQNGHTYWGPSFNEKENETLQKVFTTHANSDGYWDQQSLESYLLTQLPEDPKVDHASLLKESLPWFWMLTVYFAQWPFNDASYGSTTNLTSSALTRAIAFLSGRHYRMFHNWVGEDESFTRKTDQVVLEYIFRALAISKAAEQGSETASKSGSQRDVLDLLSVSQPFLNSNTENLTRADLTPVATRLSPLTPPKVSDLMIPAAERIASILELTILLLRQAAKFERGSRSAIVLKEKLEAAQTKLPKTGEVSFETFTNCFDSDNSEWAEKRNRINTIYDGIALLFNTFINPESLKTGKQVNWSSGAVEDLNISSLRSLGLTSS